MALRHALAIAIAILGVGVAGCSSSSRKNPNLPFPVGAEDCSTYCRVWVPPTYRDVPEVVCCKPGKCQTKEVCVRKVEFQEVVRPGCYETKRSPCRCHKEEAFVQVSPGSDRWVPTTCGCSCQDCFRHERIPPTYKLCEKTVTDKGVEYCAFQEPEYDVVPCAKTVKEKVSVYKPAEYSVRWNQELFQEGHWEWRKCNNPAPAQCGPCAPPTPPCGCNVRQGFGSAPSRD